MKKRFIILFAVMAMLLCLPIIANAEIVDSGNCGAQGDNVNYALDDAGTLTISGEGDIQNYSYEKRAGSVGSYPYHIYCDAPFYNTGTAIKNVIIEEGVTSIGNNIFAGCGGLTSVTIPASVTSIGEAVFNNSTFSVCTALKYINVNPNNQNYIAVDGVLLNKDKTEFICYPKAKGDTNYIIPDSITKIDNYIFMGCNNLTSVTIPDSVISIGTQAFEECSNLMSVTIGRGVTSISNRAFEKCYNLESVYISDLASWCNIAFSVYTYHDSNYGTSTTYYSSNPLYYAHKLYINNQLTTDIVIPNDVTSISKYAFRGCRLNSVTIPNSVANIGQYAFIDSGLQSITIQDGISRIQQYAFSGCKKLSFVSIPKSVQNIANNAFENCKSLSDIYYAGTAEEWRNINIGTTGNDSIGNAIIHYSSTSMPKPTSAPTPAPMPTPIPTPYIPLDCNVDYVVESSKITFEVEVKDIERSDELNNVQLFKAIYNENGQFAGVTFGTKSTVNDGKITITTEIPDTDAYKFFLWDGHFAPLMEVVDKETIN